MKELWPVLFQYGLPALLGLVAGVVGSLVAPWVQWAIEKRRSRQTYRRELIQVWRKRIELYIRQDSDLWVVDEFSQTSEYSMMKQYLSSDSRCWIEASVPDRRDWVKEAGSGAWTNEIREKRKQLLDEVARLEKEWGLV